MTDYRKLAEKASLLRLITEVYPTGVVSYVADTFDFWKVITEIAPSLKEEILAREGKVVFRPDSGDPVKILTGYIYSGNDYPSFVEAEAEGAYDEVESEVVSINGVFYECGWKYGDFQIDKLKSISEAEVKGAVETLWDTFGGTTTSTGYKLLDSHVGLIYGDSITLERAEQILSRLAYKGFASGNVVFGIGSFTYEYVTRDTFGLAMKATAGIVNGELREIFKDPATDAGTKRSAKGLLRVEKEGNNFVLYDQQTPEQEEQGALELVFKDGVLYRDQSLAEIRAIVAAS